MIETRTSTTGHLTPGDVSMACAADDPGAVGLMIGLLARAASYARAPISGFVVGAVARGASGALYLGANIEFPGQALNLALHAEQSAVANAWRHDETAINAIAVSYVPCGHCRQFLTELVAASSLEIFLPDGSMRTLAALLPEPFGPAALGLSNGLLVESERNPLRVAESQDIVMREALAAARRSYVPYSNCPAGAALQLADGQIFAGGAAESAAYNPSLPALTNALSNLVLSGGDFRQIARAVLVEKPSNSSQRDLSDAILKGISSVALDYRAL